MEHFTHKYQRGRTLSVRLEDENGSLLVGKQINVRIRSNFTEARDEFNFLLV